MFCLRSSHRFGSRPGLGISVDITRTLTRQKTTKTPFNLPGSTRRTPPPPQNHTLREPLIHSEAKSRHVPGRFSRSKLKQIVVYHAGTGKIAFIGMMRVTTILVFVVSCTVVAPAFYAAEFPWYIAPAIVLGGTIPMLFVSFTAAPFVNQVHLLLPSIAQRSGEHMREYISKLPRNATLIIETMKFNFYPKRTPVTLSSLVPQKSMFRPVSFMNRNPSSRPWWQAKDPVFFFTPEKSRPAKSTSKFLPEVWESIFARIKVNQRP